MQADRIIKGDGETIHIFKKRGPGRPRSVQDMRAYKAAKAKEYRRLKAANNQQEKKP